MTNVPKATDLGSRLADLEQRVSKMERTSRLNSASIGRGGLTVRHGGSITIEDPGDLVLALENGDPIWRASQNAMSMAWVQSEQSGLNFPEAWTEYGNGYNTESTVSTVRNVPKGFQYGAFFLAVDAGATFSGEGNLSVQPMFDVYNADTASWVTAGAGPAVNSGNNSVSVANSFWSRFMYLYAGNYTRIRLRLRVARVGTLSPGSSNWHVSAFVMFTRSPIGQPA